MSELDRRSLLKLAALTPLAGRLPRTGRAGSPSVSQAPPETAAYTLRIATGLVELSPDHILSTTLYNDQFPGPLLRFREGERVVVDLQNDTDVPEQVHWHGQSVPVDVDGAAEEGTPFVPPHGTRRIAFVPRPSGFRFVHTHVMAGPDLARGTYTGQVCPVYIEPKENPGAYDREVFVVMKEFSPSWSRGGDMAVDMLAGAPLAELKSTGKADDDRNTGPKGFEVGYDLFSINGRMRGHGDPIRVKRGERVLFHLLNASATEIRSFAIPGHTFKVLALDGNAVPTPASVPLLWLGTAERVSAIVQMNHPGVWVAGDLDNDDRRHGMGIILEYAGSKGPAAWVPPAQRFRWDYTRFGHAGVSSARPDQTIAMTIEKQNGADRGFNRWMLNGSAFSHDTMTPAYTVHRGERVRIRFRNASDDVHPLHLHRHTFELTRIGGKPTSGVMKDVVMLGGFQELEFDFVADNPGRTLFHCHQQLHMDYGFMALFDYA
jgi:FtsP/CotA-like multicopper oxidase with cupredoxin domain